MKPINRIIVTLVRISVFLEVQRDNICRLIMLLLIFSMLALGYVKDWRGYEYAALMAFVWGTGELLAWGLSRK